MLPILLSLLVAPTTAMGGVQLYSRAAQSIAVCTQQFAWMDNSKNISPCQVAASLDALCNNGNWVIPALNASVKYNSPAGSTASLCTCSWASYNLISACIACQGFPEQITQWSVYSVGCPGLLTNAAFPTNLTLPDDVTIPYWAGKDPTQWSSLTFNVPTAQQIAAEGHADITNAITSIPKKSNNTGAIVGGVIGGLLVIFVAVAVAVRMLRRHRKFSESGTSIMEKPAHIRSVSDTTTGSNMKSAGYTTLTSSTPMLATNPPTSPTMLTHSSSVRSAIPGFMSSIAGSIAPYGSGSPLPPQSHHTSQPSLPSNPEDVISPYTLPPTNNPDTKQANGAYPVFDPPNAPPLPPPNAMRVESYVTPTQRARYNPPAYEESSGSSSGPPRHREKQPSTDSLTSSQGNFSANDSGMPNIVGVVGPSPPTPVHQGHRPQLSTSTDGRRPTLSEASFDPKRLA